MAEVNPELARLCAQVLEQLQVPAILNEAHMGVPSGRQATDATSRIDAYGAAFQRLYKLIEMASTEQGIPPQQMREMADNMQRRQDPDSHA